MPYVVGGMRFISSRPAGRWYWSIPRWWCLWSANPLNTLKIARNASDEQGIGYFDALRKSGKRIIY